MIADFGMSRSLNSELSKVDSASCYANGSLRWQSPELLDSALFSDVKPGISTASDVYSFAAVCLEVSGASLSTLHAIFSLNHS